MCLIKTQIRIKLTTVTKLENHLKYQVISDFVFLSLLINMVLRSVYQSGLCWRKKTKRFIERQWSEECLFLKAATSFIHSGNIKSQPMQKSILNPLEPKYANAYELCWTQALGNFQVPLWNNKDIFSHIINRNTFS